MDIARYSIKTPVNTWLIVVICLIGGLLGLSNIGRLEDPSFAIKQVKIMTAYPGANAETVEKEVTEPLEIALQQMSQLLRVTSISKPGLSDITMEVKANFDGTELPQIWDELRKRMVDAKAQLPNGAKQPQVIDDFGDVYGLYYALTAPEFSPYQLREFSRIIRRELLTVSGVAKVQVSGMIQEQITATIDPARLANFGLSFPDIKQALDYNLRPFSQGRMLIGDNRVRIPVETASSSVAAVQQVALGIPGSTAQIRLSDIADLSVEAVEFPSYLVRYNGKPAITLAVAALSDENVVDVGQRVNEKISHILSNLPAGIALNPIYDQANIVDKAVDGFVLNLQMSVAVVTLALMIFMGWRAGLVVGSVLLLTVLGTVLIMWLYGIEMERISLGAMVIAMGMLVDNAIVVAEGMMVRMHKGYSAIKAASFIVKRTQWPLLGATVIGIAAFSGIGLSDDATGEFLFSLFAVIMISLLLSWVLALTVVPLFGSYFFKTDNQSEEDSYKSPLHRGYYALLVGAIKHRWISIAALVAVTVSAYASFGLVKQGFFPPSDTPMFYVHYWSPQTQDIKATERKIKAAETFVLEQDKVVAVSSFIGRGADRYTLTYAPQQANESYGLMIVETESKHEIDALARDIRQHITSIDPDAKVYSERIIFGPGGGAKLEARFSGPEIDVLRDLANKAKTKLFEDGQVVDIRHDWRERGFMLAPVFDEYTAGIAGVSRADFSDAIKFSTSGLNLGKLRDGDYDYQIMAKSADGDDQIQSLNDAQVWSQYQRKYVPLRQVSKEFVTSSEELQIHRRDRIRTITVKAEPGPNETASHALARIKSSIEAIELPEGYKLEWGGEQEKSADAQKALGKGLPLGFLAMLLISIVLFGSVRQPLIIWLTVPMAICGVVAGLLTADLPFGFMSLLGFLSLFGMLIKNGIVLVEEIDLQIIDGLAPKKALIEASLSRLRPVALAAITTILGMAPLLSDGFFADMSVTIMGGLAFATVLTLIAIPVLYSLFFGINLKESK